MTTDRQTNRQKNKQTGQKQYAPDHSIRGHKKWQPSEECMCHLRIIAIRDNQESETTRQTHVQTDRKMPDKVIPMGRYASQATQKLKCFMNTNVPTIALIVTSDYHKSVITKDTHTDRQTDRQMLDKVIHI